MVETNSRVKFVIHSLIASVCCYIIDVNYSYALEPNYNLFAGTSYSDNSLLTNRNTLNELSLITLAGIDIADVLPKYNYTLAAGLANTKYTQNTLADTTYYTTNAIFNWIILPTSLFWLVNNNLSVQDINQTNRPLPNNKRQINIFATGPSYIYKLSPVNDLLVDYRFSDIKYETRIQIPNIDSKRDIYSLAVNHKISVVSNISLNYDKSIVRYRDITNNNDFSGESIFLQYDIMKVRSTFNFTAGINTVELKLSKQKFKSNLFRLGWTYQINFRSNLIARYSTGLSDATNDVNISNYLNSGVVNVANLNDTTVFQVQRLNILYNVDGSSSKTAYSVYIIDQDYDNLQPNQSTVGATVTYDFDVARALFLTGGVSKISRKTLSTIERRTVTNSFSFGTRYYFSPQVQFITLYTKNNRTSTLLNGAYDENIISFSMVYTVVRQVAILQ